MRIDFSRGFMSYAEDAADTGAKAPKNETLEEHLKHCRAKMRYQSYSGST